MRFVRPPLAFFAGGGRAHGIHYGSAQRRLPIVLLVPAPHHLKIGLLHGGALSGLCYPRRPAGLCRPRIYSEHLILEEEKQSRMGAVPSLRRRLRERDT